MQSDKVFYDKNKRLYDVYASSLKYIASSSKNMQYDNINRNTIKRLGFISQFCASYWQYKPFDDAKKATIEKFIEMSLKDKEIQNEITKKAVERAIQRTVNSFEEKELKIRKEKNKISQDTTSLDPESCAIIWWKVKKIVGAKIDVDYNEDFEKCFFAEDTKINDTIKQQYDEFLREESEKELENQKMWYKPIVEKMVLENILSEKDSNEKEFYKTQLKEYRGSLGEINSEKIEKIEGTNAKDYSSKEKIKLLDEFAIRFPFDNRQLLYEMIDDKIDITEKELRYVKNIADLEKSLNDIKTKRKLYDEFESDRLLVSIVNTYDCLYKNESALYACEKDIQACTERQEVLKSLPELVKKSNNIKKQIDQTQANIKTCTEGQEVLKLKKNNNDMLNIKSQHKVYFWLCRKYETLIYKIFIIGFLFGFIAWLVRKCSKDIEQAELTLRELGSVHIKSESKIKAREIVEIKIELSLS